ncbi:hypothetical protein ACTIVE_8926 [Actinomadura verrucosospora]|uniref:Uncharacterized protein n=1 Tax=Actinomadura verrucosospora TaxID=46165 RepID=A0A7D3VZ55_ACTVE|nr:hypothetical protein ACTIVE_8926 [Actinomadura verrucosospora]
MWGISIRSRPANAAWFASGMGCHWTTLPREHQSERSCCPRS